MSEKIVIIDGLRSPMGKIGGSLRDIEADDLGATIIRELLIRNEIDDKIITEVIIGNAIQPVHAANIARVIALKAKIAKEVPAYTVHRNCASGMESIAQAVTKIKAKEGNFYVVAGVESMTNSPLLFNKKAQEYFTKLSKARTVKDRLKLLIQFKLGYLKPVISIMQGLTDPISGLMMGNTAEILAKEFNISREEQDEFAMLSHNRAEEAQKKGVFKEEIYPILGKDNEIIEHDEGIRYSQNMKDLGKLKPYFDRKYGSVTAGNSSQLTDAAATLIVTTKDRAKELNLQPIAYIKDFAYAGLDPERMGLGPVYATHKLLKKNKISLKDIDLIEINEAFAAQVIACEKAFNSDKFAQDNLGEDSKIGEINRDILNVNGGSIALGHPIGMTGTRLVLHIIKELRRRGLKTGLATLCIGGGQGAAFLIESI